MAEGGVGWGGRGGDEKGAGRNHIGEGRSEVEGREGKEKAGKTGRDKKKKGGGKERKEKEGVKPREGEKTKRRVEEKRCDTRRGWGDSRIPTSTPLTR